MCRWSAISALSSILTMLFIVANLSVGYTFSTIAKNQLQAMQMSFFFFLPSILLSGFMFPFRGMPDWAQNVGSILPLTHYLRIVRGVMLKGRRLRRSRLRHRGARAPSRWRPWRSRCCGSGRRWIEGRLSPRPTRTVGRSAPAIVYARRKAFQRQVAAWNEGLRQIIAMLTVAMAVAMVARRLNCPTRSASSSSARCWPFPRSRSAPASPRN